MDAILSESSQPEWPGSTLRLFVLHRQELLLIKEYFWQVRAKFAWGCTVTMLSRTISVNSRVRRKEVVLWINQDDTKLMPAIGFDSVVIDFLARPGGSIDVDTNRN